MNVTSTSQVVNRFLAAGCDECVTTTHLGACPHSHKSCPAWGLPNTGKETVRRCLEDALTMENGNDWRSAMACQVAEELVTWSAWIDSLPMVLGQRPDLAMNNKSVWASLCLTVC